MDDSINFENEEAIQIDDGSDSYGGGAPNHNPFMSNNAAPQQDFNQPYADSPAPQ
jgi:hypothetical protein